MLTKRKEKKKEPVQFGIEENCYLLRSFQNQVDLFQLNLDTQLPFLILILVGFHDIL